MARGRKPVPKSQREISNNQINKIYRATDKKHTYMLRHTTNSKLDVNDVRGILDIAYTITWTTVNPTWVKVGGTASAPTLATTGYTWILLWKVGSTVYATEVGKP